LSDTSSVMNYKISVLVFIRNKAGKLLMIQRAKSPNKGLWSPIGGKLEMETGESPHECAVRETFEEIGLTVETQDLRLFCMIAEKAYEGANHWLMFLFDCKKPIERIPESIDEGRFAFYSREAIDALPIPDTEMDSSPPERIAIPTSAWRLWSSNRSPREQAEPPANRRFRESIDNALPYGLESPNVFPSSCAPRNIDIT
jgi:8-oxo-dGTP diphosphatase